MREAARFDRRVVSVSAGLLAAIPVVVLLGGGIAAGDQVAAVTMSAGAMLVGIAWRTSGGRPPLALMATDALVMSISTFVGCVTGSLPWLHFAVLCVWSLMGGLLVGVGNRGSVVGTQAIIAVVVFGRFSQPAAQALGLAGLVLAGGCAQVVFLGIVRWPNPLRFQRGAMADAYRALASLARASHEGLALPAANALDDAKAGLSSPTLFADPAVMTLRSLVNEGHRLRVQLTAINALLQRDQSGAEASAAARDRGVATMRELTGTALSQAALAIEGDSAAADELARRTGELSTATATLVARIASGTSAPEPLDAASLQLSRRLAALAGQMRAVCALAPDAGKGAGIRSRRPQLRTHRPIERLRGDLGQIGANATLNSPAARHALRLAVVVPIAEVLSRQLPLQRGYWIVVAAATVLRPEFGATFTRGTERALGTCLGVALAGGIAVGLHPAGTATVVLVGLLASAGYAVFPASFAVGFGFITALVVFLLNTINPDTLATAGARLLDTLVGGALGLLAYVLWPTWSRTGARQALADLVDAGRAYLQSVLAAEIEGQRAREQQLRPLSRRARLARTSAEAAVARSLSEPETRRIDADQSQGVLGAMRRLMQSAHLIRLDVQEDGDRPALPTLAPLASNINSLLGTVERTLMAAPRGDEGASEWPDLRADYFAFERRCPRDRKSLAVLAELDEIVDAANGLAVITGIAWIDGEREQRPSPRYRRGIRVRWLGS